jgi:hypothetical protein
MGFAPERVGGGGRINVRPLPPGGFIAAAMHFAMMAAAERHGKFVAHLAAKRPVLGKAQMMRIGGGAATYQTGLLDHEPHMLTVAYPAWLGMS